ncbi:hypothetical protein P3T37_001614 [Kitasatospora sp. MAA4]|uniref:hypothetical protein n=1 Tax=Kitasatospora sp. MAA4 TaxID=3035093 RepID=UPI00247C8272|nr:hypothetical protein [Kitasatospora sp. MAA4]
MFQALKADAQLTDEVSGTEWVPGHAIGIPDHEVLACLPARMIPILRKACDEAERAGLL